MLLKLKNKIKSNIEISKAEAKIRELNDNDKSIRTLKRLRILATAKVLNIIGIVLFIFVFTLTTIAIRLIDFIMIKINDINSSYPIYKFLIPNLKFWIVYMIVFISLFVAYIILRINIKASFETLEKGQKGSSRISTLQEIQKEYHEIPEKGENFEGKGGVPISRFGNKIYIDITSTHTIVIGTTRSGKGQGFVLITIDIYSRAEIKSSLIFNDPKGELCGQSKELLEKEGYDVKVIDFLEMTNSIGYNPLEIVKEAWREGDFGEAELRCRTFTFAFYHNPKTYDKTWEDLSMNLVNALILALCERCIKTNKEKENMTKEELEYWKKEEMKVNLFSVASMLSDLGGEELEEGTAIDIYFDNLPDDSVAKRQYSNVKFAKSKTRASVFVTASQKLQVYLGERVAKLTSFNDLKLEDIGFYKSDIKKVNVVILDMDRPNEDNKYIEEKVDNQETEDNYKYKGEVKLVGAKDIICYRNDIFSKKLIMNGVTAIGVAGQDLTDKIEVNYARVMWQTPGIYEMEYSVCDKENSKPIALFLILPDFDKSNHILATTCISQITYMLSRRASLSESGATDREVVFILDEAGNMAPIEDFAEKLTVSSGRGLKFIPIIQSFSQLKEMYGENYKTLIDNCANTLYIKTTDTDTSQEISKMTGEKTIVVNSRSGSVFSFNKSITENLEQVPVIRYDDLIHLKEGETVVIKPMHRRDLDGNKVTPYPIYNSEEMGMKFKYEYLNDIFSKNLSMRNIYIKNSFNTVSLEELKVNFKDELADLIIKKNQKDLEESIKKELLREKVRKELEKEEKEKSEEIVDNRRDKAPKIKRRIITNIIKLLKGILNQDELDMLKEIKDEEVLKQYLNDLHSDGRFDYEILEETIKCFDS